MNTIKKLLIGLISCIGLIYVTYFGFCQGWWLQDSMWTHYWWMCSCGPEFEESLYSEDVEIVVSACQGFSFIDLSPNGRYLFFETKTPHQRTITDLVTGKAQVEHPPFQSGYFVGGFWTNTLYLAMLSKRDWTLINVSSGKALNLTHFEIKKDEDDISVSSEAIDVFQQAHQVLTLEDETSFLALAEQPEQEKAQNAILFYPLDGYLDSREPVEAIFAQHHITYTEVTTHCSTATIKGYYGDLCTSYNNNLLGVIQGIFTMDGQKLTDTIDKPQAFRNSKGFIGWAYDDSGIYISLGPDHLMGEPGLGVVRLLPEVWMHGTTVIKLNVPETYRNQGDDK